MSLGSGVGVSFIDVTSNVFTVSFPLTSFEYTVYVPFLVIFKEAVELLPSFVASNSWPFVLKYSRFCAPDAIFITSIGFCVSVAVIPAVTVVSSTFFWLIEISGGVISSAGFSILVMLIFLTTLFPLSSSAYTVYVPTVSIEKLVTMIFPKLPWPICVPLLLKYSAVWLPLAHFTFLIYESESLTVTSICFRLSPFWVKAIVGGTFILGESIPIIDCDFIYPYPCSSSM